MAQGETPRCALLRTGERYDGRQGLTYSAGISSETVGSKGICLHILTMPPGACAYPHYHENHESAVYMLRGKAETVWGDRLENHHEVLPGDLLYIPAGVPHTVWNPSETEEAVAVIARTDPNEQESVVMRPDLDPLVPKLREKPAV